jgi:hypothetical protein
MRTTERGHAWHWAPLAAIALGVACLVAVLVSFLWWDSTEWHLIAPIIGLVGLCVGFVVARHLP